MPLGDRRPRPASGKYSDRTGRQFEPDMAIHERYRRIAPVYDAITTHTDPLLEKAADAFAG